MRFRGDKIEKERRIQEVEEQLCVGVAPGRIESDFCNRYKIKPRQVQFYISEVYKRWMVQTQKDAPHRREKVIRMAERFYARALSDKQYSAAGNVLNLLARLSGAFTSYDPSRQQILDRIGLPPTDPTQAVIWAQQAMLAAMHEILSSPSIDPERRIRLLADLGSKVSYTHAKALIEAKVDEVRERVFPSEDNEQTQQLEDASDVDWPKDSRFGSNTRVQ